MGTKHLPAIDGLRAIAVLSVVAYHAGAPAGFVGVDVFFVISGYLITGILLDRPALVEFYARRARRILPAAFLCVLVTLALSFALLPSAGDVARSAASAGLFVANVFFQHATGDYWSDSADTMPLLHLWSLSVEEQFYLLWPLVLLAGRRWLPWVAALSLALFAWWSYADPSAAFYQMPARAWELAAGGLIAAGYVRSVRFGLPLVLLACLVPMPHWAAAPVAVLGSTFLIASIHAGRSVRVLEARPLVYVGLISYSLYLWHWPLLAIDRATRVGVAPLETRLALVAIAFVLAVLSYRYVETPFRKLRFRPGRTVLAGIACAMALSLGAWSFAPAPIAKPQLASGTIATECEPFGLGWKPKVSAPRCVERLHKVVLWGDSFAIPWQPLAKQIAMKDGLPLTQFFDSGCPTTAGVTVPLQNAAITRTCRKFNDDTLAWVKAHGADTLVIASFYAQSMREHPREVEQGVRELVAAVRPHVGRILFVAPTPELRDQPWRCKGDCVLSREEFHAMAGDAQRMLAGLNVEVVDPGEWYVGKGPAFYTDQYHVTQQSVTAFLRDDRFDAARQ